MVIYSLIIVIVYILRLMIHKRSSTNQYLAQLLTSRQTSLLRTIRRQIMWDGKGKERATVEDKANRNSLYSSKVEKNQINQLQDMLRNSRINSKYEQNNENKEKEMLIEVESDSNSETDQLLRDVLYVMKRENIVDNSNNQKELSIQEIKGVLTNAVTKYRKEKKGNFEKKNGKNNQNYQKKQAEKGKKTKNKMMVQNKIKENTRQTESGKGQQNETEILHLRLINHIKDQQIIQMKKVIQNLENKLNAHCYNNHEQEN